MYLLGGNTAVYLPLFPARNDVIWSTHLKSPWYTKRNPAEWVEIKSYYVIMRETLAHKITYNHLTRMATVDEIINTYSVPWKAKN